MQGVTSKEKPGLAETATHLATVETFLVLAPASMLTGGFALHVAGKLTSTLPDGFSFALITGVLWGLLQALESMSFRYFLRAMGRYIATLPA